MWKSSWFSCIFLALASHATELFVKPCVWNDKNCILEAGKTGLPYFIKGIPELDISPSDPIEINDVNADSGELKLQFKDMKVVGIGKSVLTNLERADPDKTVSFTIEFPVFVTGKYKARGKILVLDVEGDGETEIKSDKIRIKLDMRFKKIEKGGVKYYKITGYDYTCDPIEKVSYQFNKLYNGDEQKAQVLLDLVNQNWKDLFYEVGKPVVKAIIAQITSKLNKFFLSFPINKIEIS